MTSIAQYVDVLLQKERIVADKLGVNLGWATKSERVINRCMIVLIAVVVKEMVDKGLTTDAEMLALLNSAGEVAWADMPFPPDGTL